MLEEILTGEMLTRVWTAVLCAYDRRRGADDAEPVARSVLIGHMEARHRVLTLLVRAPGIDAEAAVETQPTAPPRRTLDRSVGRPSGGHARRQRVCLRSPTGKRLCRGLAASRRFQGGRHAWPLVLASLRAAFRQVLGPESPNADLNARIAASILACFPAELFDSTGLLRSLWLMRLTNVAEDTQGMIDELFEVWNAHGGRNGWTDVAGRRFGARSTMRALRRRISLLRHFIASPSFFF